MITLGFIMVLVFSWLLVETNFMRVRLQVGCSIIGVLTPEYERMSWEEVVSKYMPTANKYQPFWYKYPANMSPLCGLDWLENTMHIIPEYRFELKMNGNRYDMRIKDLSILKEVMKVNKLSRKELVLLKV